MITRLQAATLRLLGIRPVPLEVALEHLQRALGRGGSLTVAD